MKTLIELYDERPIENVLASEVFQPERTVFLCPEQLAKNTKWQEKLRGYFIHCGLTTELVFLGSSLFNCDQVLHQLRYIINTYEDCCLDITGGTDAALFACGQLCTEQPVPTFTYSHRRNRFFSIQNAAFAHELSCDINHNVEDCFLMAGGTMRPGRTDNTILIQYIHQMDSFFHVYLRYRTKWTRIISFFQLTSQAEKGQPIPLSVESPYTIRGHRGNKIDAPVDCLRDLESIHFLSDLYISEEKISYTFTDHQIRSWLRDIGSVLELYVYKACLDAGIFNDVRYSAVVDWEGESLQNDVTNEIDIMAMQGITPAFISCKTCQIDTAALNELAILRDRFGGDGAKAAIVTTQNCRSITRHRAAELRIDIIDLTDLKKGRIIDHIKAMMRP